MLPSQLVVFSALDGALLDSRSGSWGAAEEALAELERRRAPLVLVAGRTRAEVEALQRRLGSIQPFVTEHGGGIFIPHGYFPQRIVGASTIGRFHCVALGRPYEELVEALEAVTQESGVEVVGFHNLSPREIARNTGLPMAQAELARRREFEEPFFFAGAGEESVQRFIHLAGQRGVTIARGARFCRAFSGSDPGRAVKHLMKLYRAARPGGRSRLRAVGLGANAEDLPMLAAVDVPILLPQPGGAFDTELERRLPRARRLAASGPAGWNEAVLTVLAS